MFCLLTFRGKSFPILGFYAIKSVGYHLFGCPENVPWAKLRVVADVCKPINLEDREAWGLQTQAWATQRTPGWLEIYSGILYQKGGGG